MKTLYLAAAALCLGAFSACAHGGEVAFRRHVINAESAFSASAAIDVNRDGRLDIVCGKWWYEAPRWERHFVCDVQFIRGRYEDYSALPLDVNADGWMDLITANYRSRGIYWIEHPGPALGPWTRHVIEKPGPMETGRLADVDGDGRLDVLPNGRDFAAWWEVIRRPTPDGKPKIEWMRHDLPREVVGHGVGFGDINGDGRSDVVGPGGWLEAPKDRRRERWRWHPDFKLHPDASVPILVTDVDRDGDSDLIWGRGHRTGVYWLEQVTEPPAGPRWRQHAIDTSWSQAHTMLLADVDNDNQPELIAGKRYMGHDGKDPGEHDPLAIYWYDFVDETRSWRRGTISFGGRAGMDLDSKAVDLDADGDLDLLTAARSGLFVFENLLIDSGASELPAAGNPPPVAYGDHSKLLLYQDEDGRPQEVATRADWAVRRHHILENMQLVMGPLPGPIRRVPLDVEVLKEESTADYMRRKITYAAEGGDRVPAYLLVPHNLTRPAAAMLCLHQTTKIGKDEPAGLGGKPSLAYAHELAQRGYVCIAPDYPSFGDYAYDFRTDGADYKSGVIKAVWNNLRAVDLLQSMPEVDPDRIGCIGHSLGGHTALFTAALDLRIKAVVSSCGFTAFHHYFDGNLRGWTSDRYMPQIARSYDSNPDKVPFDFYEIVAAIAPRGVFVNAPTGDRNFDIEGVKKVVRGASEVYSLLGMEDGLEAVHPETGHAFPDEIRRQAYVWLRQALKRP